VTFIPFADFLAGALLSLLLPVTLLMALVVWYVMFIRRVPETGEQSTTPEGSTGAPEQPVAPAPDHA
jgi:hypothetical protein